MSFAPVIDIEALCAPVSEAEPVGVFLDPKAAGDPVGQIEYGSFRKMSRWEEERHEELWGRIEKAADPGPENWDNVIQACQELLKKSKDLRILRMLIVAVAYRHGIPGIRDGFRLVTAVVRQYRGAIYPQPYSKAVERLTPLPLLLAAALEAASWTPPNAEKSVTLEHWKLSDYLTKNGGQLLPEQLIRFERTAIPLKNVKEQLVSSSEEYRRNLLETLDETAKAAQAARGTVEEVLKETGEFSKFETQLSSFVKFSEVIASKATKTYQELLNSEGGAKVGDVSASEGPSQPKAAGPLRERQEALAAIESAMQFFQKSEPHSPVPGLLTRAVRWAGLSFDQLMNEMLSDNQAALVALRDRANLVVGDKTKLQSGQAEKPVQPEAEAKTSMQDRFG